VPSDQVKVKEESGLAQQIWFGVVEVTRVKVAPMSVHALWNLSNLLQPFARQGIQKPFPELGVTNGDAPVERLAEADEPVEGEMATETPNELEALAASELETLAARELETLAASELETLGARELETLGARELETETLGASELETLDLRDFELVMLDFGE